MSAKEAPTQHSDASNSASTKTARYPPPPTPAAAAVRRRRRSRVQEYEHLKHIREPESPERAMDMGGLGGSARYSAVVGQQPDPDGNGNGSSPTHPMDSARSIRKRIPWSKRWWFHRCVQFSHVLSLSNVLMFPNMCSRHGGVAFLIAYVTAYMLVGIPLLCAEMALGQFSSVPPIELFRKMSPSLSGIGVSMLAVLMLKAIYFSAICAQSVYMAILTIKGINGTGEQAWQECAFAGSSQLCFKKDYEQCAQIVADDNDVQMSYDQFYAKCQGWIAGLNETYTNQFQFWRPPHMDYMAANVFKPIFTEDEWSFPHWLALILIGVWLLKSGLAYINVRNLGTPFIFLKFFIVLAMFVNMILSVNYDVGSDWLDFFNAADLSHLWSFEIWTDAIAHVITSLNLGSGTVHKISSLSDFNENFLYNSLIVSAVDMSFSFIMGISFFSAIGSVAHRIYPSDETPKRIQFMLTHGFVNTYTMFPEHIIWSLGKIGSIIAAFHYTKIAVLVIPGVVISLGIIRHATEELMLMLWPKLRKHELPLERCVTAGLALFCFCGSITFVGPGGFMLSSLWHEFCATSLLLVTIAEVVAISYHYGFRRYLANVQTMLQGKSNKSHLFYTFSAIWYYFITPSLLMVTFVFKFIRNRRVTVLGYLFPHEFEAYGWSIVVFVVLVIACPVIRYLVVTIRTRSGTHLFEPMSSWGPIERANYEKNLRNERAASVRVHI